MPRASLRSVLLICAFSTACMCRVSTQITGNSASARALNSHCDSGPASSPIRLKAVGGVPQNLQKGFRLARYLHFLHDPARVIHNADAGLLYRYVQSTKMVHAALLLLMLEAVTTDLVFTISLKRSTQNLQLSTTWAGRLHHLLRVKRTLGFRRSRSANDTQNGHWLAATFRRIAIKATIVPRASHRRERKPSNRKAGEESPLGSWSGSAK